VERGSSITSGFFHSRLRSAKLFGLLAQGADLQRHIDSLSAFDYATRATAARMLRRAQAAYWQAEEGSTARVVTATLIDRLEF
jgi:hypothetical protein